MAHKTSTYSPLIFKNFSHHGTKTSQKVTVCFTLPSAANCLPTMYCLGGPRRWKLLGPNTASRLETSYSTMDGRLWTTTTTTSPPPWTDRPSTVTALLSVASFFWKQLGSKQIGPVADMKQAVTSSLQTLNSDFSCTGMQALLPWWDKC